MEVVLFYTPELYVQTMDILRNLLRRNRNGFTPVALWTQEGERDLVELRLNRHNLYIEGFTTRPGGPSYRFSDALPWAGSVGMPFTGQHAGLMTPDATTLFTDATRFKIDQLRHYDGTRPDELRRSLGFFVVAISEALRFRAIQDNIAAALNGGLRYRPAEDHRNLMSEWRRLTEAGDARVDLPYLP
ncbi:ribosome-inactivating family protein [Oceaniglobus roseus]|uniref:ribosome-inactivating family protein n=1 Tax=Oceaniglobus roseus TaxID=1737570 RepID=UPI000C7F6C58|nr:ribosome-inactivating family protein [Kandeliimicrobium roseum]